MDGVNDMVGLLVKLFIKDSTQIHDLRVRGQYGILAGLVGIFLNLCLFAAKFFAGLLTSAISITADAFNNLSDAGSSVVTLLGFQMAGRPADHEHPFGHGRMEYLSGLLVSMAIMLVGIELVKSSFDKILHPQTVTFQILPFTILIISILIKLWMSYFNRTLGTRIESTAMKATAMDSLTDVVATSAVAVGVLISHFFHIQVDGWIGMLVALFILYSGFTTARDSLSPLLGQAPDAEFVRQIEETVLSHPEVIGLHDLIVHDYGPGRCMISLHAEVPSSMDVLVMHDAIDLIELELRSRFHCEATIHMDPIVTDDKVAAVLKEKVKQLAQKIDPEITIHDFRMVQGKTHTNLIFDVTVPHKFWLTDAQVANCIRSSVQSIDEKYFAVIRVEKAFI